MLHKSLGRGAHARAQKISEPRELSYIFVSVFIYLWEGSRSFHQTLRETHDPRMLLRMLLLEKWGPQLAVPYGADFKTEITELVEFFLARK